MPAQQGCRALESSIERGERLVTDAEVLQEILHRHVAIGRSDSIQPAFNALLAVVDEVLRVRQRDVERARDLLLGLGGALSARDALHVSMMRERGVTRLMSFDRGLDRFTWIERLSGGAAPARALRQRNRPLRLPRSA